MIVDWRLLIEGQKSTANGRKLTRIFWIKNVAERFLNKKILKAIDAGHDLFWEFGVYNTYYHGLILRAYTGYAETGIQYIHIVFVTTNIDGAKEIREILKQKGIAADTGWKEAFQKYDAYKQGWQTGHQRNSSYGA